MSGPIQVIPKGLLGLLQLKQQGSNPSELADVVASCINIEQYYWQQLVVDHFQLVGGAPSTNVPTASPGNKAFVTNPLNVPQGQLWYVLEYSLSCSLVAAETIRFAPLIIYDPALATPVQLGLDYTDVVTARARAAQCFVQKPFWAPAGSGIGFWVGDSLTAGNIVVTGSIRAVVIPI